MSDELDDLDSLAAEYVLGTLDHAERQRAEDRRVRDQAFDQRIDNWTRRLSPLADAVPAAEPPPEVWQGIEKALNLEAPPEAAPATTPSPRPAAARFAAGIWRIWAVGATAAAAALAFHITTIDVAPQETRFVAVLSETPASPAWVVTVDTAAQQLTIRPVADVQVADNSLELWLVAGGDAAPQSLGLLDPGNQVALPIAAVYEQATFGETALAVSLEPVGGSPTGLPTGPILYQGAILPATDTPL